MMKNKNSLDSLIENEMIEKIENSKQHLIRGGDTLDYYTQCHVTQDQVCQGNDLCTCDDT